MVLHPQTLCAIILLAGLPAYSQLNVGNALNNLNTRTLELEQRQDDQETYNQTNKVIRLQDIEDTAMFLAIGNGTATVYRIEGGLTNVVHTFVNQSEAAVMIYDFVLRDVVTNAVSVELSDNKTYYYFNDGDDLTIPTPVAITGKDNMFTLTLKKGGGNVTWFPNINWIYGEPPSLAEVGAFYVFRFRKILEEQDWDGWLEYQY